MQNGKNLALAASQVSRSPSYHSKLAWYMEKRTLPLGLRQRRHSRGARMTSIRAKAPRECWKSKSRYSTLHMYVQPFPMPVRSSRLPHGLRGAPQPTYESDWDRSGRGSRPWRKKRYLYVRRIDGLLETAITRCWSNEVSLGRMRFIRSFSVESTEL